jgi:hypothetical protein
LIRDKYLFLLQDYDWMNNLNSKQYAIINRDFVILAKILKTFIHGLSVEAGSRHSRASRLPSKAGSSD